MFKKDFLILGKDLVKIEAEEKARGEYKYASDISVSNMLHCKVLRSPHPHAIVKRIDTTRAERLPGVKAVITHKDVPQIPVMRSCPSVPSTQIRDSYILEEELRHTGDRVAAVAAISPEVAEEALELIKVEYEVLPAVFNDEQAMQPDAPLVHHKITRGYKEIQIESNILQSICMAIGNMEEGFKQADLVLENEFKTGGPNNSPLERSTIICQPLRGGRLEVWATTQTIHGTRINLTTSLGLPRSKIKVHLLYLGGAFGAHINTGFIEPICAFLAIKTGMPVRGEESREEMFLSCGRHPATMKIKTGVKKDGTITALDFRVIDHTGAYATLGEGIMALECGFSMSMYRCRNMRAEGYTVYTNTPPRTAMRGAGNPQQNFAVEQQIDIIAEEIGIDPLELRLKNHIRLGDRFYGQGPDVRCIVQSCGTEQLIKEGAKLFNWHNRKSIIPYNDRPWIRRGIGMARGFHTSGAGGEEPSTLLTDYSGAIVIMNEDGTANLITASADCGGGSPSAHAAMVAEELGIRYEDVIVAEANTDVTPHDVATHASRATYCMGLAVKTAATNTKKIVLDWASRKLKLPADQLDIRDRSIYLKTSPSIAISIKEVLETAHELDWGTAIGTASLRAPACPPHFIVTFVEVDVDTISGEVKVLKAFEGADVGTPINPQGVRGQIIGGLHMGLGYALTEDTMIDPIGGQVMNAGFRDFKIFTSLDMPEVYTKLADTYEPTGPFGAKGAGEGATNPVAAAVGNAIFNAIGVRIKETPITPEKILKALNML